MNQLGSFVLVLILLITSFGYCQNSTDQIVWNLDNLNSLAGQEIKLIGSPKVVETDKGKAVQFDGVKDALLLETLPLEGLEKFTVEVIFQPDPNGPTAQRFLHMQENTSKNRVLILIETLSIGKGQRYYLDTYVRTSAGSGNLYKPSRSHSMGQWYNATLICDGSQMRHYINSIEEISKPTELSPLTKGKTSIGAKLNQTSWFKGKIRTIRFTSRALKPKEFLRP